MWRAWISISTALVNEDPMPGWMQTVADVSPVDWAIEAGRSATAASPDWGLITTHVAAARRTAGAVRRARGPGVPQLSGERVTRPYVSCRRAAAAGHKRVSVRPGARRAWSSAARSGRFPRPSRWLACCGFTRRRCLRESLMTTTARLLFPSRCLAV